MVLKEKSNFGLQEAKEEDPTRKRAGAAVDPKNF